jgi:2-polyprenyl-3-methyl-5-hydroxy-6-metoxy-1,4-benzoquinol methylase
MQERHSNREQYFNEQAITTQKFVIPFIQAFKTLNEHTWVMEPGCGEGGNFLPFLQLGCNCVGIDMDVPRVKLGKQYYANNPLNHKLELIGQDIYLAAPSMQGKFDVIFLRDTIEHIIDQEKFMSFIKGFLKPDGVIFFAFPPWLMPFGGHQQLMSSKWLSKVPWTHLLPKPLYFGLMRWAGETENTIQILKEIRATGIRLEQFEKYAKRAGYELTFKQYYFIQPNYETKFGLKPRKLWPIIGSIPWVRNFFTTAGYYVLKNKA